MEKKSIVYRSVHMRKKLSCTAFVILIRKTRGGYFYESIDLPIVGIFSGSVPAADLCRLAKSHKD